MTERKWKWVYFFVYNNLFQANNQLLFKVPLLIANQLSNAFDQPHSFSTSAPLILAPSSLERSLHFLLRCFWPHRSLHHHSTAELFWRLLWYGHRQRRLDCLLPSSRWLLVFPSESAHLFEHWSWSPLWVWVPNATESCWSHDIRHWWLLIANWDERGQGKGLCALPGFQARYYCSLSAWRSLLRRLEFSWRLADSSQQSYSWLHRHWCQLLLCWNELPLCEPLWIIWEWNSKKRNPLGLLAGHGCLTRLHWAQVQKETLLKRQCSRQMFNLWQWIQEENGFFFWSSPLHSRFYHLSVR